MIVPREARGARQRRPARYNQACLRLAQGDVDGGLASLVMAVTIDPKFFGELAARDKDLDDATW